MLFDLIAIKILLGLKMNNTRTIYVCPHDWVIARNVSQRHYFIPQVFGGIDEWIVCFWTSVQTMGGKVEMCERTVYPIKEF